MCYIIISSCLNHVAKHLCTGWTFPQKDNSQIFYAGEYDLIKTTNIDQCLSINSFLVTKTLDRQHTSLSMRGKHVTCACNKRHYTVSNTSSENKVVHYDLLRVNTWLDTWENISIQRRLEAYYSFESMIFLWSPGAVVHLRVLSSFGSRNWVAFSQGYRWTPSLEASNFF